MITINIEIDGDQIVSTWDSFTNLQECEAGFGDTIEESVMDLMSHEEAIPLPQEI